MFHGEDDLVLMLNTKGTRKISYKEVLQKSAGGPQGGKVYAGVSTPEEKQQAASVTPSSSFIPRVQTCEEHNNKNMQGAGLVPGDGQKQASLLEGQRDWSRRWLVTELEAAAAWWQQVLLGSSSGGWSHQWHRK